MVKKNGPKIVFSWVLPLLDVVHCCKLSLYTISRKTNERNLMAKNLFWARFWPNWPKIWLRQSLDTSVNYHHVQYQKKLMILSWENLVTDGQTDKRDFIRRSPTDVEHPIKKLRTTLRIILLERTQNFPKN